MIAHKAIEIGDKAFYGEVIGITEGTGWHYINGRSEPPVERKVRKYVVRYPSGATLTTFDSMRPEWLD